MTEQPWKNLVYGALRHPAEAAVLLVPVDGGWGLPAVTGEDLWLSSTGRIVPAFDELLAARLWALRQFHHVLDRENRQTETIFELEIGGGSRLPEVGRWVGAAEFDRIASPAHPTTGPMLRYLEDLESGATPHERPPWARPGWIAGVKGWITEPLAMRANPCASTHRT
jgi:hypothetical protein